MGVLIFKIYIIGFLTYCLNGLLPQKFNKKCEKILEIKNINTNTNTNTIAMLSIIIDALLWPLTIMVLLFLSKKH